MTDGRHALAEEASLVVHRAPFRGPQVSLGRQIFCGGSVLLPTLLATALARRRT